MSTCPTSRISFHGTRVVECNLRTLSHVSFKWHILSPYLPLHKTVQLGSIEMSAMHLPGDFFFYYLLFLFFSLSYKNLAARLQEYQLGSMKIVFKNLGSFEKANGNCGVNTFTSSPRHEEFASEETATSKLTSRERRIYCVWIKAIVSYMEHILNHKGHG